MIPSDLKTELLLTSDQPIVYVDKDEYWGDAIDGSGRNRLGELLMEVRAKILAETESEQQGSKKDKEGAAGSSGGNDSSGGNSGGHASGQDSHQADAGQSGRGNTGAGAEDSSGGGQEGQGGGTQQAGGQNQTAAMDPTIAVCHGTAPTAYNTLRDGSDVNVQIKCDNLLNAKEQFICHQCNCVSKAPKGV